MLQRLDKPIQADTRHFSPEQRAHRRQVAAKCAAMASEVKAFEDGQIDHDLETALTRHIERFGLLRSSSFVLACLEERSAS